MQQDTETPRPLQVLEIGSGGAEEVLGGILIDDASGGCSLAILFPQDISIYLLQPVPA